MKTLIRKGIATVALGTLLACAAGLEIFAKWVPNVDLNIAIDR